MDDVLTDSIIALRDYPISNPELWFDLISQAYEDLERSPDGATLDDFARDFIGLAGIEGFRDAAEEFVRYAEFAGGIEFVRLVSREDRATMLAEFERLRADEPVDEPDDAADDAGDDYDPDAWDTLLAEYGPDWNGDEDNWQPFREWFLYQAEQQGLTTVATDFLDYAEGEPDKTAFFAQYGIVVGADHEDAEADADEPGSDESEADEAAEAGSDVDDGAAGTTEPVDAELVAEARQKAAEVATESDAVPDEYVELVSDAFAELVSVVPAAAGLTAEQLRELIDEVAATYLVPADATAS